MVHVLPHWNWENSGQEMIPIFAYTNCEEVELFVNGKSMGRKVKGRDLTKIPVTFKNYDKDHFMSKYRLSWEAPFSPGALKVVGYVDGKPVAEKEIRTAGAPARVKLALDRTVLTADGNDLAYVTVRIEDRSGDLCPQADNRVRFSVDGAGAIAAVANGNAATTAPFIADRRKAFNGLCLLIVRAGKQAGKIAIKAESDGLAAGSASLSVQSCFSHRANDANEWVDDLAAIPKKVTDAATEHSELETHTQRVAPTRRLSCTNLSGVSCL